MIDHWHTIDESGGYGIACVLAANGKTYEAGWCNDCESKLVLVEADADFSGDKWVDCSTRQCAKCGSSDCDSAQTKRVDLLKAVAVTVFPESFGPRDPLGCDCRLCDEAEAA